MKRFTTSSSTAALLVMLFQVPAIAELISFAGAGPNGECEDNRLPDSNCAAAFVDPETGSEIQTQSFAHAEYGYVHARTTSVLKNWSLPYQPNGGGAHAFFEDIVTFSGRSDISAAQIDWDWQDSGFSEVTLAGGYFNDLGYLIISASVGAGGDIYNLYLDGEAWARVKNVRIFDDDGRQLTSGLRYRSQSGVAYPIQGASQIPEPGSASLLLVALAVSASVLRSRLLLKHRCSGSVGNGEGVSPLS